METLRAELCHFDFLLEASRRITRELSLTTYHRAGESSDPAHRAERANTPKDLVSLNRLRLVEVRSVARDIGDTISSDAANEIIRGVVNGGGVVFSRDNGAGDVDLWYYAATTGLTQVAADVSTAGFQARTLTFNGSTPNGMVVFTETYPFL